MQLPPFKNLYVGLTEAISEVLFEEKRASRVLKNLFLKNKKWGKRDRVFVAKTFYDFIRYKRQAEFVIQEESKTENLEKVLLAYLFIKFKTLPAIPDFQVYQSFFEGLNVDSIDFPEEVKESYPKALWKIGISELGQREFIQEARALNELPPTSIRANTLKTNNLKNELAKENRIIHSIENSEVSFEVEEGQSLERTQAFKNGLFEFQDYSSQQLAAFTKVKPNDKLIDACAGAGGKSLHLAALMENKGEIIALDIFESKLKELERRVKKAGVKIIKNYLVTEINKEDLIDSADLVLIDAPCSSTGVIGRNPDYKWRFTESKFLELLELQKGILHEYSKWVKPQGNLVYATCSILPSENQIQVRKFLERNSDFELLDEKILLPSKTKYDGFYMARMNKA